MRTAVFLFILFFGSISFATESLLILDTRDGVKLPIFYVKNNNSTATVLLFPGGKGGKGGMGKIIDGQPSSNNFLVRTRDLFASSGLNVAIFGLPSDKKEGYLEYSDRLAPEHMQDVRKVVEYLKKDTTLPVWIIGNSRGAISATAASIEFGNELIGGLVLTSSVVSYKKNGAVPNQDLYKIKIPVLVLHHENDECKICNPSEASNILKGLKNSQVKRLIMINGGENPTGDPCDAMHYHGFIGIEQKAVEIIAFWIKNNGNF